MLLETFYKFLANLQMVRTVGATTLLVAVPIITLQNSERTSDVLDRRT